MEQLITASPLTWPNGWPRTSRPEQSRFGKWNKPVSIHRASSEVLDQLRIMGIPQRDVIISTDLRLRQDGLPYSNQKQPDDVGVSVWFMQEGQQKVIALDKYNRIADNLWAVAKTIEAMRGIERWGGGQILERVFTGFNALPSPDTTTPASWKDYFAAHGYELAGLSDSEELFELRVAYKQLSKKFHPDRGGSHEKMSHLNKMYSEGKKCLGGV